LGRRGGPCPLRCAPGPGCARTRARYNGARSGEPTKGRARYCCVSRPSAFPALRACIPHATAPQAGASTRTLTPRPNRQAHGPHGREQVKSGSQSASAGDGACRCPSRGFTRPGRCRRGTGKLGVRQTPALITRIRTGVGHKEGRRRRTLPPGGPGSTIRAAGFHFRVRDGIGWIPRAIATGHQSGPDIGSGKEKACCVVPARMLHQRVRWLLLPLRQRGGPV
jgi:hypothetical protein